MLNSTSAQAPHCLVRVEPGQSLPTVAPWAGLAPHNQIRRRAFDAAIAELNGREKLTWANQILLPSGTLTGNIFDALETDLGTAWAWDSGPRPLATGGNLRFQDATTLNLERVAATPTQPGFWRRPVP